MNVEQYWALIPSKWGINSAPPATSKILMWTEVCQGLDRYEIPNGTFVESVVPFLGSEFYIVKFERYHWFQMRNQEFCVQATTNKILTSNTMEFDFLNCVFQISLNAIDLECSNLYSKVSWLGAHSPILLLQWLREIILNGLDTWPLGGLQTLNSNSVNLCTLWEPNMATEHPFSIQIWSYDAFMKNLHL